MNAELDEKFEELNRNNVRCSMMCTKKSAHIRHCVMLRKTNIRQLCFKYILCFL
jgi:hypothetical protein